MTSSLNRTAASLGALALAGLVSTAASAQSVQIKTPNVTNAAGPVSVTVGGTVFTNQGIVGAGRLDANTRDFRGETLGSFSGMAIDLRTWHRNADGSYASGIYTLPDRGPFDGGIDYRDRVHTENITFNPLASGSAALPQAGASQSQVVITPTGGFTLKDATGIEFTGRDPGASTVTRGGIVYPLATDGTAPGHISLDPEAIAFRPDGTFYVSDEYAAGIYYFDASGKQIGAIQTVPALLPRVGGAVNFDSTVTATTATGRRGNQGLEAMTITPDNKKLVTILQSATVQDTAGTAQATRNNTRILIYDISGNAVPTNPIAHYVLQLPTYNLNGSGGAVDRTAAQSEVLALNDNQFLVLARDGLGRGVAASASTSPTAVFKSVLLVDTTGATNLAGTQYETGTTPLASGGTLVPGIVPVQQVELVNLLNPTQLARVGMNLNRLPLTTPTTLSEKIEAMALAPVLEEGKPQDFFLFVGNDNDFQATSASFNGQSYTLGAADGTGNNDSVMLVYRLTLPTYVDPQALQALNVMGPAALYSTRGAVNALGASAAAPAMRFVNAQRGFDGHDGRKIQVWVDAEGNRVGARRAAPGTSSVDVLGFTMGVDIALGEHARIGAFGGYRNLDGQQGGIGLNANAWTAGAYAAVNLASGLYAQASIARLGGARLTVERVSVYGQIATGQTHGQGWGGSGELGWMFGGGKTAFGPFVALDYSDMSIDGYAETGASVSNLVFPDRSFRKLTTSVGSEVSTRIGAVRPALRAGYSFETEYGDTAATVRLKSAQHSMGTVALPLADTTRDSVFAELRLGMSDGPLSGYFSAKGRWGRGADDGRVAIGLGYAF